MLKSKQTRVDQEFDPEENNSTKYSNISHQKTSILDQIDEYANNVPLYGDVIIYDDIHIKKLYNFDSVYKKISNLGKGSSGTVDKYKNLHSKNVVALKEHIISTKQKLLGLLKECLILEEVSKITNSISKIYNYFLFEKNDQKVFAIEMELVKGSDLGNYVREAVLFKFPIKEKTVLAVSVWLCQTIAILHEHKIIHRDIKLDNIIMDTKNKRFVLIDFGLSCSLDKNLDAECKTNILIGTPSYISPEIISPFKYGENMVDDLMTSDIWAIGIALYILAEKKSPWNGAKTVNDLYGQITNENYPIEMTYKNANISEAILSCLNRDVLLRPNAEELGHIFLGISESLNIKKF